MFAVVEEEKSMNRIQIKPSREAGVMTFHADEITKKTLMGSIVKTSFVSLNYIKMIHV